MNFVSFEWPCEVNMSFSPLISLNLKMRRETKEKENEIKREI